MVSAVQQLKEKYGAAKVGAGGTARPSAEILKHPAADTGKVSPPDDVAAEVAETVKGASRNMLADLVAEFNSDHFVSIEGCKTSVYREAYDHELGRARLDRMGIDAFRALHSHETIKVNDNNDNAKHVPVAEAWLKNPSRRTYPDGIALLPEGNSPASVYNLWRGFGCAPKRGATRDDVKPALVHLLKVVCGDDRAAFDYFIGWLAYGVQNPGKQAEVAIVLQGGRGSGKGTVGRWFRDLFGAHGMHIQHPRHLTGNFNAHLQTCLAMFVDEAFFVGDRAGNGVLKALITEDQMVIEKKGIDVASVRNRLKIIMATNEGHAVIAGTDERRYLILQVSNIKAQDHKYFGGLDRWWGDGGKEALLGYLLGYDLAGFNIRKVPNTAALERQKLESLGPFDRWLFEKLSDGNWNSDSTPEQWAAEFSLYAEKHGGTRFVKASTTAIGMQLRDTGIPVVKTRQTAGSRKNVWGVPELSEARRIFAEKLGLTHHRWGDGQDV